jgi:hypothetical protein
MSAQNTYGKVVGRFILAIHTKSSPSDVEWDQFLDLVRAGNTTPDLCFLVFTDGGAPSGSQRKRLADALSGRDVPIAVHSHAMIPRFVNASIALFNKSIRSYSPEEFPQAIEYLKISTGERTSLLPELQQSLQVLGAERLQTLARALKTAKWV